MNKIDLSSIPTDSALPADLYDADGKVFAQTGEAVAPSLLELSKAQQGLYGRRQLAGGHDIDTR